MTFDFSAYQAAFNSGDDEAALAFWHDDLTATLPNGPASVGVIAANKQEFREFLANAHIDIREVMRLQSFLQNDEQIFAEFDMDFVATDDRSDFDFGPMRKGEFITVKMFGIYTLKDGLLWKMNMAFWPVNQGVTDPPSVATGLTPPDFGPITRRG